MTEKNADQVAQFCRELTKHIIDNYTSKNICFDKWFGFEFQDSTLPDDIIKEIIKDKISFEFNNVTYYVTNIWNYKNIIRNIQIIGFKNEVPEDYKIKILNEFYKYYV